VSYAGTLGGSFANLQLQMPYGWRGALANIGKQIVLTTWPWSPRRRRKWT